MIRSIHLQNLQSHKDTKLEFSDGVNVIVGSSDSGKSAILRGLGWVATNRPAGDEFRSDWAGKENTSVSIQLSTGEYSGEYVERIKGPSINAYSTGSPVHNREYRNPLPPRSQGDYGGGVR